MCLKDLDEQYTPDIAFLFCTALFFILMYLLQTHIFLPCVVFKTKMSFAVFNCHIILIENLCRVLCKSMLPTMFNKLCVKLKHIHLTSYLGVEKVNAAL